MRWMQQKFLVCNLLIPFARIVLSNNRFMFNQPFFQQHLSITGRMASSSASASSNNRNEINERQCLLEYHNDGSGGKQLINYAISGSGSSERSLSARCSRLVLLFSKYNFSININNIV